MQNEEKLPNKLFRYRSIIGDRFEQEIDAIEREYIWCSNYRAMNDAMEGYYRPAFKQKDTSFDEAVTNLYQGKLKLGLASLTEEHGNELMWTHYAANFKGICIEYNAARLAERIRWNYEHKLRPIQYVNNLPDIFADELGNIDEAVRKILIHKKASWQYEKEWRILAELVPKGVEGSIAGLYLGARIPVELKQPLISRARKALPDIHISQVQVNGFDFGWEQE